ncbi:hypothetical protein Tco_0468614 [Tanacetum coccineum]
MSVLGCCGLQHLTGKKPAKIANKVELRCHEHSATVIWFVNVGICCNITGKRSIGMRSKDALDYVFGCTVKDLCAHVLEI